MRRGREKIQATPLTGEFLYVFAKFDGSDKTKLEMCANAQRDGRPFE